MNIKEYAFDIVSFVKNLALCHLKYKYAYYLVLFPNLYSIILLVRKNII